MRWIQHCLQLLVLHTNQQLQEMVGAILVDHGSLQVSQVMRFLLRKYKHRHQHVKLIQDQILFLKYFFQVILLHMHL